MAINLPIIGCLLLALAQFGFGQVMPPSPAPSGPSNDGNSSTLFFFFTIGQKCLVKPIKF